MMCCVGGALFTLLPLRQRHTCAPRFGDNLRKFQSFVVWGTFPPVSLSMDSFNITFSSTCCLIHLATYQTSWKIEETRAKCIVLVVSSSQSFVRVLTFAFSFSVWIFISLIAKNFHRTHFYHVNISNIRQQSMHGFKMTKGMMLSKEEKRTLIE